MIKVYYQSNLTLRVDQKMQANSGCTEPFSLNGCFKGKERQHQAYRGGQWYHKKDTPARVAGICQVCKNDDCYHDHCICQFCKDNGCYGNDELVANDIDKIPYIGYSCDCQHEADHPTLKLNCCTGLNPVSYAKWYTTSTEPNQFICEYCAENGCYTAGSLRELVLLMSNSPGQCACTKRHPHIVNIVCPKCQDNTYRNTQRSNGTCKECLSKIPITHSCCMRCANKYQWCMVHGSAIKDGNEYIDNLIQQRESEKSSTLEELILIDNQILKLKAEFGNKNHTQVFETIVKKEQILCKCAKCKAL